MRGKYGGAEARLYKEGTSRYHTHETVFFLNLYRQPYWFPPELRPVTRQGPSSPILVKGGCVRQSLQEEYVQKKRREEK